jgi:hypothetical protein
MPMSNLATSTAASALKTVTAVSFADRNRATAGSLATRFVALEHQRSKGTSLQGCPRRSASPPTILIDRHSTEERRRAKAKPTTKLRPLPKSDRLLSSPPLMSIDL